MDFHAFADGTSSYTVDNLTFENNAEHLAIYGDVHIGQDQQGLQRLLELQQLLATAITHLQAMTDLPEQAIATNDNGQIDNPF